ncbi:hypothetical protein LguiA_007929 [Lonicera macranthoides]
MPTSFVAVQIRGIFSLGQGGNYGDPNFRQNSPVSAAQSLNPLYKSLLPIPYSKRNLKPFSIQSHYPNPNSPFFFYNVTHIPDFHSFVGWSNEKPGGPSTGRIEGNAELRDEDGENGAPPGDTIGESSGGSGGGEAELGGAYGGVRLKEVGVESLQPTYTRGVVKEVVQVPRVR